MIRTLSRTPRVGVPLHPRSRGFSTSLAALATLGMRREDPRRVWERRAPLTPDAVKTLAKDHTVEVEACERRCFPDEQYEAVGAKIVPKLSNAVDVVLGIKEPRVQDVEELIARDPNAKRTWMMFSHTHKGQPYNTGLLATFLPPTKGQTLIDHELLTAPTKDGKLKRVAAFGWYAGAVGAGEALSLTGLALLRRGIAHPLLHLPRPYTFGNMEEYKAALRQTGEAAKAGKPLEKEGPVVIGLTGAGNVSTGAKDMLDAMGVEWVDAKDLPTLPNTSTIYACQIPPSAYFERKDGGGYDRSEYYMSPDLYKSTFDEKIAPYITTLIHGAGWSQGFPRIMTNAQADQLIKRFNGNQKLIGLQDVSCDIEGALEFMNKSTTIDEPYFDGPGGMLIGSTDILPTELPADASSHFSKHLLPYVERTLQHVDGKGRMGDEIDKTLARAMIVEDGVLQKPHDWLEKNVRSWKKGSSSSGAGAQKKRILLLGSGLVAGPAVDVFLARPDVSLVIASNNAAEAAALARDRSNVTTATLDVSNEAALGEAVAAADVVVSLLPAPMHPQVAKHCISHGRHLVTASYVSPEMKALNKDAEARDVLLLGECGLDPGIDSMAAMRIMERVEREGKRVTSFVSWCGGLPEPSASNVPLAYKFSWSPRAVLTASQNDAHYKLDGVEHTVPGNELLAKHFPSVDLWKGLKLEGLANRDSMPYAAKYGLGPVSGLTDLYRGTLRYQGFSKLMDAFRRLGLISQSQLNGPVPSWPAFLAASMSASLGEKVSEKDLVAAIRSLLGNDADATLDALKYFSLLPEATSNAPPLPQASAPIDYFAALLANKLAYKPGERDTCLLHHGFRVVPKGAPEGTPEQTVTASLLCTGNEKASSMATTVGCTLAFAALRVADGKVDARGVHGPYSKDVWSGVLDELANIGVEVKETWA